MKKIFSVLLVLLLLTGCGSKIKGKCHAEECIKKLDSSMKVEDVNKIIGFEGEESDGKYTWKINDIESIEITFGSNTSIKATIDNKKHANKKVNFSKHEELNSKVKEGIEYNEFKELVGNVDGIIVGKTKTSNTYLWIDKEGHYIKATFSNLTNKCIFTTMKIN